MFRGVEGGGGGGRGVEGRDMAPLHTGSVREELLGRQLLGQAAFLLFQLGVGHPALVLARHGLNASMCAPACPRSRGAPVVHAFGFGGYVGLTFEGQRNHQMAGENSLLGSTSEFLMSWAWLGLRICV